MKLGHFHYDISVESYFSNAEVMHLFEIASHHYDGHCKSQARQGGFLWGMRNGLLADDKSYSLPETRYRVDWRMADTMQKILEQRQFDESTPDKEAIGDHLCKKIAEMIRLMRIEATRLYRMEAERAVEAKDSKISSILTSDD